MYQQSYRLRRGPFEISPDPAFLFHTKKHYEALATLYYGVRHQKGFVVLTGEVGTGKTLLVRCLLHLFQGNDFACAYVFNSRLSPREFLQYIAADLGLAVSGKNKTEILLELGRYLLCRHHKELLTVLVVDEAHDLSAGALEEVRLLTNLETAQRKLLQVLLVGQLELDEKLDSIRLRQLKQRIALRCHLGPLDLEESGGYIRHRLQLAGTDPDSSRLFPDETVEAVYRYSAGIPRLINTLCENALITAYARQLPAVPTEIIDEVAADLRLAVLHPGHSPQNPKHCDGLDRIAGKAC